MRRALIAILLLMVPAIVAAQSYVDVRVQLTRQNGASFTSDSVQGIPGVQDSGKISPGESTHGNTASNMQIQIRVESSDAGVLSEKSPNGEGLAVFRLAASVPTNNGVAYPSYRIHVVGSNIEEAWLENITPGQGDRFVTIAIHPKGEKPQEKSDKAMVSASELKIPSKAAKEFEAGSDLLAQNKLLEAKAKFQRATEIYPQYDQAFNNLGIVLMKLGAVSDGQRCFERALEINPRSARAYLNLARLAMQKHDYASADEKLRKTLSIEPLNAEALGMAAQAASLAGKYENAVGYARRLHSVPHAKEALAHYAAGYSYTQLGRPAEAAVEYNLFLKEDPASPLAPKAREILSGLEQQSSQKQP